MTPKLEIYEVRFNKYRLASGDVGFSRYTINSGYDVADMTIVPIKIVKIKDHITVYFSDGGKHIFGADNQDVELFYRPVEKKEKPKTE